MNFDRFLPTKLKEFFSDQKITDNPKFTHVLVLRRDGIILYSSNEKLDKNLAGALMGGAWQAAFALSDLMIDSSQKKDHRDVYRLSFDTSSEGLYMVPFQVCQQEYYLSILYQNQMNPALLKCRMRDLGAKLGAQMTQVFSKEQGKVKKVVKEKGKDKDKLFMDLTDAEMDNLFSFVGSETCPS